MYKKYTISINKKQEIILVSILIWYDKILNFTCHKEIN